MSRGATAGRMCWGWGQSQGCWSGFMFCLLLSGSHFLSYALRSNSGKTFTSRRMARPSYERGPQALPPRSPWPLPVLCSVVQAVSVSSAPAVRPDAGKPAGLLPTRRGARCGGGRNEVRELGDPVAQPAGGQGGGPGGFLGGSQPSIREIIVTTLPCAYRKPD